MSERPKVTSHVTQEILLRRIERAIAIMSDGNDAADVQGTLQICRKMLPSWQTGDPPEPGEYWVTVEFLGECDEDDRIMVPDPPVMWNGTVWAWPVRWKVLAYMQYIPRPSPYQPEGE